MKCTSFKNVGFISVLTLIVGILESFELFCLKWRIKLGNTSYSLLQIYMQMSKVMEVQLTKKINNNFENHWK